MFKLFLSLLISFVSLSASAQMLVVDRAPTGSTQPLGLSTKTDNFLADDFQVGAAKEDWVIDHIRLWILPDSSTSATALGDIFKQIALYGGIAPDLPPPGPPPSNAIATTSRRSKPPRSSPAATLPALPKS